MRGAAKTLPREQAALDLIAHHGPQLRAAASRVSICSADAEDAYQRGLEIVLTKAPTVDRDELVRWACTVVRHEALGIRRKRTRAGGLVEPADLPEEPNGDNSPEEAAERLERSQQVAEALGHLRPQQVRCLILRAEGYSYAEICELAGLSMRQVTRSIYEGRARFLKSFRSIDSGVECIRLRSALSAYADSESLNGQGARLRRHLLRCGNCRATLKEYRETGSRLAALVPPVLLGLTPSAGPGGSAGHGVLASLQYMHEAILGGAADRAGGLMQRAQQTFEGASATKTAAVVASTAALAGGGTVAVEHAVEAGHAPARPEQSVSREEALAPPATPDPAPPAASEPQAPAGSAKPAPRKPEPGTRPQDEFGRIEGGPEQAGAPPPSPAAVPSRSDGSGEFGGIE